MTATPSTDAPCYLSINPAMKYVTLGTANLPSTLTALSVQNRVGDQDAVIQSVAADQPGWSSNAISGAYIATTTPGAGAYPLTSAAGTSASVGVPGFTFNGSSQFFEYDGIASEFSGTETGVTVSCVVQRATTDGYVWAFGAAGATPFLLLKYASGALTLVDSNGTTSCSVAAVNNNLAVVSASRSAAGVLSLRVWANSAGAAVLQTATATIASPAATTYSTFCIGATNIGGSVGNFFTGNIGKFAVFGVQSGTSTADVEELEAEWLLSAGVSRLTDLAGTSGSEA